jgi:hypothetical protein
MNRIDITLTIVCSTCRTSKLFRVNPPLPITISEHGVIEMRVDPDEFQLCPTCHNPLRLHIQSQPYELVNHLDSPVAQAMYDMGYR